MKPRVAKAEVEDWTEEGRLLALGTMRLPPKDNLAETASKCEACFNGHDRPCTDEAGCPCPCSYLENVTP